jgi:sulfofructose kinase
MNVMAADPVFDCIGLGLTVLDQLAAMARFPEPNSKNVLSSLTLQGGGPVPTALTMLARLGKTCSMVTALGDDTDGQFLQQDLCSLHVDTSFIKTAACRTPRAFILLDQSSGERTVLLDRDPLCHIAVEDIQQHPYNTCRLLHIDGHYPEAQLSAAHIARQAGGAVSIDLGSNRKVDPALLSECDIIVVSEVFVTGQLGVQDPKSGLEKLFRGKTKWVGITCGIKGSYFFDGNQHIYQPAFFIKTVDSTGAGDVFHGAVLYAVLQGFTLTEAALFASAAAAIKCQTIGRKQGMADLSQIKQFLNLHGVPTHFLG